MNLITIIQARYSSSRLPGKVLKKYKNMTYLELLIKRLKKSNNVKKIIVATSKNIEDKKIEKICNKLKIICFKGPEEDVIDRYFKATKKYKAKNIVRITADCPLIDPKIIDQVVDSFFLNKADYATNTMPPTFPDGLDVEVFKFKVLKKAWTASRKDSRLKEHVTTHIRKNKRIKKINIRYKKDFSFLRLTLDELEDVKTINSVLNHFKKIDNFGIDQIIKLYNKNKNIFDYNIHINRNEGKDLISGQKMWKRAKKVIPGGTMLFSKNPDLFLPAKWPAYFSKSKGCKIWDLNGNCFKDLAFMGVGTNTLGYAHPNIEKKVFQSIKSGLMTTLNSVEEINLAEKLVEMHPWSNMVRFTRSGGEANSVAIRIARAASGKDNVAICGYHGWHDWYLACNINNSNKLNSHLMKEVPIGGVPKSLKNTVIPFEYNNFNQLEKIVNLHDIGVIKMEVMRDFEPKNNFLKKVRNLANKKNIVLIFDECTSGFRQTYGGLHKFYKINPDISIFGKALGNGHAINAVIGTKEVMEHCNSSFISSTFWTERVGPTAALATLKEMEKIKSWDLITNIGKNIKNNWKKIADDHKIKIKVRGLDAIPNFSFESSNHVAYKTYITQEMLKKNFLASNVVYCSVSHEDKILKRYLDLLERIFFKISQFEKNNIKYKNFLETGLSISGIREGNIKR